MEDEKNEGYSGYVLKKLAAYDLLLAYIKQKMMAISSIIVAIVIYGSFIFDRNTSMIVTLVSIVIFGWQMYAAESKVKYYEGKYDLTRPKSFLANFQKPKQEAPIPK